MVSDHSDYYSFIIYILSNWHKTFCFFSLLTIWTSSNLWSPAASSSTVCFTLTTTFLHLFLSFGVLSIIANWEIKSLWNCMKLELVRHCYLQVNQTTTKSHVFTVLLINFRKKKHNWDGKYLVNLLKLFKIPHISCYIHQDCHQACLICFLPSNHTWMQKK